MSYSQIMFLYYCRFAIYVGYVTIKFMIRHVDESYVMLLVKWQYVVSH
jgi:hypothetical protein